MISSCEDCKDSCCRTGPGPYKKLAPEDYLENFGDIASYNTKCTALRNGQCTLWGTADLPVSCRIYVCQTKTYTAQELEIIDSVSEEECPNCGSEWLRKNFQLECCYDTCEVCGYLRKWVKEVVFKGNVGG